MGYLDMIKEGLNNIDNGDPVKALVCFTSAAAIGTTDFDYSSAFFLRAMTYKAGGFDKKAIANYKLAADYYEHKGALNELQDSYSIKYTPVKRTGRPSEAELKLDYDGTASGSTTAQPQKPSSSTASTAPPPAPKPAPASSSTSMPSASPALLKQYSNYKYVLGMYDWIDNLNGTWKGNRGKGYLIIAMDKTDGDPDIKNAKFIFDGFSEGMLIRNNKQVVYMPVMDNYIKNILLRVKEVFIAEMDNKNNIKEYTVKIDVINNSLPIPVPEKNRMKAQLK